MSGRNGKWAIRVQPVRVMGLHVLLFGLSTLTVMWSSISLVRIQVLSWKKVQVCDNCYILKLRVATFLNMLQLFPTVPTKTEISQAATVQGRYNVNRGIKFLTFCQKIKNKNLNFSFPITLLLVSDFKKKKNRRHAQAARGYSGCLSPVKRSVGNHCKSFKLFHRVLWALT